MQMFGISLILLRVEQKSMNCLWNIKSTGIYRPSRLRRAIFGPSSGVCTGSVRAISGPTAKQQTGIASLGRYITAHGRL